MCRQKRTERGADEGIEVRRIISRIRDFTFQLQANKTRVVGARAADRTGIRRIPAHRRHCRGSVVDSGTRITAAVAVRLGEGVPARSR